MRQTSVTHVITTIEIGGAENQLLLLIREQIQMGYLVRVIPIKGRLTLKEIIEEMGVEVDSSLLGKSTIRQILQLRKLLKKFDGIIHCHLPQAEIFATICAGSNSKLVASRHFGGQFYPGVNKRISKVLSRIFSLRTDAIIAVSESVKSFLLSSHEVVDARKIVVVEYGYKPKNNRLHRRVSVRSDGSTSGNHLVVGMLSRLSIEKRIDKALHAHKELIELSPNAELIICGEGPELAELIRISETLGLTSSVQFVGKVTDVHSWYEKFDVFLHTSDFEGFGMVYLEAMSNYLPIVTLNHTGVVESLRQFNSVTIVECPQDPRTIALSILAATRIDKESIKANFDIAIRKFDPSLMAKKIECIYFESNE